ncbi:MAG: hypothetical protein PUB00_00570 [Clostridiales bacterium]|nr:hypothetical protein [Clostridiales bacterium]
MHHTNFAGDSIVQQDSADVEMMLYICKNCDKSISMPLLKGESERSFLFPVSTGAYLYLSFEEDAALYDRFQSKLALYIYPYITFRGFERESFLRYVNNRIFADLVDHGSDETVGPSTRISRCPYCGSQKLKPIGKLAVCSPDESQISIRKATLNQWNSLPEEKQNRKMILLLKQYASEYPTEKPKKYTLLRKKEERKED